MDIRRRAVYLVTAKNRSVSSVARECGISRTAVYKWLSRAKEQSFEGMSELSRRPSRIRQETPDELVQALLGAKLDFPFWGAKKLVWHLWGKDAPLCVRTADRILARHGFVNVRKPAPETCRFERASANELWQMDFKGLKAPRLGYSPLSVLDDATRFCLALTPVAFHTGEAVWEALWSLFEVYGLPGAILSDNEPCFSSAKGLGPSLLETRLWRLGVRTLHGRPLHPQTQGKVERFHRTVKDELGQDIRQPSVQLARLAYEPFVFRYNWERPHEALNMAVPGELYTPSGRARPDRLPEHEILGLARKVDASGKFSFKSGRYRAGKGLLGEWVDIRQEQVCYAGVCIGLLSELRV